MLRDLEINTYPYRVTDRRKRYANDARIKDARKLIIKTRNADLIKRIITLICFYIYEKNCSNKSIKFKIRRKRIARTRANLSA
jgi:hypothetical protein